MTTLFDNAAPFSTAVLSECGTYRYRLGRRWDNAKRDACFIMLNPSTADAHKDDPTIRRCIAFAKAWGCGGLVVVNLFALRSTDPRELYKHAEPIGGIENDRHIRKAIELCRPVVAAWGVHGALRSRDAEVLDIVRAVGVELHCLKVTKDGHPAHPLYQPTDAELIGYGRAIR